MTNVLRIAQAVFLAAAMLCPAVASAGGASPWAQGFHSRVRILAGGTEGGRLLAGIEIGLDKGFKTYWRTPGEAGLPPQFDWTGSVNLAAAEVKWPPPQRSIEAGSIANLYSTGVILPVLIQPQDPTKPVKLNLVLEYGICKDICIPARAQVSLGVSGAGSNDAAIRAVLKTVPRPQKLAAEGPLSILGVERIEADKPTYRVRTRSADQGAPTLFAEGPEDWYLSVSEDKVGQKGVVYRVTIEERPQAAVGPMPLRLTLVQGENAVETELSLDGALRPR